MFKWFRKKQIPVEDTEAYKLGRRTSENVSAEIEAYMQADIYPRLSGLVDVVFGSFDNIDVPPLVAARIDLKLFLDRLDGDLRPTVLPMVRSAMEGWISAGLDAKLIDLSIEHHFNQLKSHLASAASQRLLDMTDTLKKADQPWRAANPERAAQIAFDEYGSELADALKAFSIDEMRASDQLLDALRR